MWFYAEKTELYHDLKSVYFFSNLTCWYSFSSHLGCISNQQKVTFYGRNAKFAHGYAYVVYFNQKCKISAFQTK